MGSMSEKREVVLVGGGLVGSLIAVMLGQRGFAVTVYEKRPDMRRTRISAGRSINLALAERGIHALRQAGLMEQVAPLLIPMKGRQLHPPGGKEEFSPYGQRPHEVIYSVSRGLLNQTMLTAAESSGNVRLHFDLECRSVDLPNRQLQLVDLKTGRESTASFELLLGTDGSASPVRTAIAGGDWHTDWLDHDYKELEIPAGPGGTHQLAKNALHIWPRRGFMLIALPNLDGSFTVTLFLDRSGDPGFDQLMDAAAVAAFFEKYFPDAMRLIPDLAADFAGNPTGSLGTVHCRTWTDGQRALLLGDAAHAIVPFHGQGMNAGFEDCAILANMLDEADGDLARTMRPFETLRRPAAGAIAEMAIENYRTMRDSVLDPLFQLKKELGFELERRFPDRFIPRYSMVMFHNIPYDQVQQRGMVQEAILEELVCGKSGLSEIDWNAAAASVLRRLTPVG